MLPHKHVIISAAVGAAGWWFTGKPAACMAAMATGVLPDIDHIIDYGYCRWRGVHRLVLPLHGSELALVGAAVALHAGNAILGIALLSYLVHLLADQSGNRTHILGYSLLFRARPQFPIEDISTTPGAAAQGTMDDIRVLRNAFQRWIEPVIGAAEQWWGDNLG
jgi:hypothetical protein